MTRMFKSGATRNDSKDKLEFIRFNDPRVEKVYAYFMHKHRHLPDGTLREPDNWKLGFDDGVILDSRGRHFLDSWEIEKYGKAHRPDEPEVNQIETLCAELFGIKAKLYELVKDDKIYEEALNYFNDKS